MSSYRPLLDQVFILRFWREGEASDKTHWRGLIRNINTRRREVVDDVQRAFAIIDANLSAAALDELEGPERVEDESPKTDS